MAGFFDYNIIGEGTVGGRKAALIAIVPNSLREENYSFGNVWVDKVDYSILKIEWDQRSIKDIKDTVESRAGDLKRTESGFPASNTSKKPSFLSLEENTPNIWLISFMTGTNFSY